MSNNIIPYDPKIDICLDSLQTFVASYEELTSEIRFKHHDIAKESLSIHLSPAEFVTRLKEQLEDIKCKQLVAIELQSAVNKSMLDLLESMMKDAYPRAQRK